MREVLDVVGGAREEETVEQLGVIRTEPGEQRQVVAAREDVHRVDLQNPEPLHHAVQVTGRYRRGRTSATESLGSQGDASGLCGAESLWHPVSVSPASDTQL